MNYHICGTKEWLRQNDLRIAKLSKEFTSILVDIEIPKL